MQSTASPVAVYYQHPAEVIRYQVDFSDRLAANEVSSWSIEAEPGVVLTAPMLDATGPLISFDVAGGADTYSYFVAAQIATNDGQIERQALAVRFRGQILTGPTAGGVVSIANGSVYLDGARVLLDSSYLVLAT